MENSSNSTRKKFLSWGAIILGSATVFKFIKEKNQEVNKPETVKMLTQDGTLVEIDIALVGEAGKIITDTELQQWIKK